MGERSGLWAHIGMTESVTLCVRMKVSAQLEPRKPAPQIVDKSLKLPAFHNQPSPFTVWRLFVSRAYSSLKSKTM